MEATQKETRIIMALHEHTGYRLHTRASVGDRGAWRLCCWRWWKEEQRNGWGLLTGPRAQTQKHIHWWIGFALAETQLSEPSFVSITGSEFIQPGLFLLSIFVDYTVCVVVPTPIHTVLLGRRSPRAILE